MSWIRTFNKYELWIGVFLYELLGVLIGLLESLFHFGYNHFQVHVRARYFFYNIGDCIEAWFSSTIHFRPYSKIKVCAEPFEMSEKNLNDRIIIWASLFSRNKIEHNWAWKVNNKLKHHKEKDLLWIRKICPLYLWIKVEPI